MSEPDENAELDSAPTEVARELVEQHDAPSMPGLARGRDVMFVHATDAVLAAKVTHVWDAAAGTVNLVVFGDMVALTDAVMPRSSVEHDPTGERVGTWHWPVRV